MPLYRPSHLRKILEELSVTPKKTLSQYFLIDGNILRKIIAASNCQNADCVIEIGPGPGVLTEALLETSVLRLIAVEKDHVFAKALPRLDSTGRVLEVIEADVLEVDFDGLLGDTRGIVVANIPYHITTKIVEKILFSKQLESATLLMQHEVAKKLLAQPSSREYGLISLLTNYFAIPSLEFLVPQSSFYPVPKVVSSVVRLQMHKRVPIANEALFLHLVTFCFQRRRKMIGSCLKELYPTCDFFSSLPTVNFSQRAEDLTLEAWKNIVDCIG